MRKWIKWGALALVVLLIASTITVGYFVERDFDQAHQRFAEQYDFEYSKPRNNRGLFGSDVEVCLRPRHGLLAGGASWCASYDVQYGPLLWRGGLHLGWMAARITPRWPGELDAMFKSVFDKQAPLQLLLQARFGQQLYLLAETPAVKENDLFTMDALQWQTWIDLSSGAIRTEGHWPALNVQSPMTAELHNLRFDGQFQPEQNGLLLGQFNFNLDRLHIEQQRAVLFDLQNAHYHLISANSRNGERVDHTMAVTWQRLQMQQNIPTVADIQLVLADVDKTALQQLNTITRSMPDDHVSLQAALTQLLAAGLKLRIDRFDISSDSVHSRGSGEFVLAPNQTDDALANAITHVSGKMNWSLPLGLLNQWLGYDVIQQWLAEKRVWLEGNLVQFQLTINNGEMHLGLWRVPLPVSTPPVPELPELNLPDAQQGTANELDDDNAIESAI